MDSTASQKLSPLAPAMPTTVLLQLEHFESDDYFQQMLIADSALEALDMSLNTLKLKVRAWASSASFFDPDYHKWDLEKLRALVARGIQMHKFPAGAADEFETFYHSLLSLETLHKSFTKLQAVARHGFEQRARALRAETKDIMDLPDEILCMIFNNFRLSDPSRGFPPESAESLKAVQSARLTCKRFRGCSSHLLIPCLNVILDMPSLHLLEHVLSNPEISQGVQFLNIDLRFYAATVAEDLSLFSTLCFHRLVNRIHDLEEAVKQVRKKWKEGQIKVWRQTRLRTTASR
jgi:hypothetical protein